jgi:hypothetical protein
MTLYWRGKLSLEAETGLPQRLSVWLLFLSRKLTST